jgi:hypothetical protein
MSKKYFINNLDTPFGQALLSELVKEPTEDPPHMCTVRVPVDQKPPGNDSNTQASKRYSRGKNPSSLEKKLSKNARFTSIASIKLKSPISSLQSRLCKSPLRTIKLLSSSAISWPGAILLPK